MNREWKRTTMVLLWLVTVAAMLSNAPIVEQLCWVIGFSLTMGVVSLVRG